MIYGTPENEPGGAGALALRWRRAIGRSGRVGLLLLSLFAATALLAPCIAPYDPRDFSGEPLQPPSAAHWLGTDDVGHDLLSELLWGARVSLAIGLIVGTMSMLVALGVALVAGVYGGWIDRLLMRVVDGFLAVPRLPFIVVLAAFAGPSMANIILALVLFSWAKGARIIRAQVLVLAGQAHVEAARLLGASRRYVILRHILPEVLPLGAYKFVKTASYAVVAEAGLSFLGIGDPTVTSWGMMFYHLQAYPGVYCTNVWVWWLLPPASCLALLILGLLLLQQGVEALAAPRQLRQEG